MVLLPAEAAIGIRCHERRLLPEGCGNGRKVWLHQGRHGADVDAHLGGGSALLLVGLTLLLVGFFYETLLAPLGLLLELRRRFGP